MTMPCPQGDSFEMSICDTCTEHCLTIPELALQPYLHWRHQEMLCTSKNRGLSHEQGCSYKSAYSRVQWLSGRAKAAVRHLRVACKDGVRVCCVDRLQAFQGCLRLEYTVHNVNFPWRCCQNILLTGAADLLCVYFAILWRAVISNPIANLHAHCVS